MNEELAYLVYEVDEFIEHSEKTAKENPKLKKSALKLNKELMALKETLVVTKGDNYVGTVENQLREKLSEIYASITGYYGAPTKTQLENSSLIEEEMSKAKQSFASIKSGSMKKYSQAAEKAEVKLPTLKSYKEFVDKE